jgi:D-glycero-alpha-D-manno-heptose-7-phosphate kinase
VQAFAQIFDAALTPHQVARMAFEIERIDLGMAGGRQDQYAAVFGGVNFMEFLGADKVVVKPVPLPESHMREFESCLLVCHTGRSRLSSSIIEQQVEGLRRNRGQSVEAMQQIKQCATEMRAALLDGDMERAALALGHSWEAKKRTAAAVSSAAIDEIYALAQRHGAWSGKISGAGGGGHMMFMVPPERRFTLSQRLVEHGLSVAAAQLVRNGSTAWTTTSTGSLAAVP